MPTRRKKVARPALDMPGMAALVDSPKVAVAIKTLFSKGLDKLLTLQSATIDT